MLQVLSHIAYFMKYEVADQQNESNSLNLEPQVDPFQIIRDFRKINQEQIRRKVYRLRRKTLRLIKKAKKNHLKNRKTKQAIEKEQLQLVDSMLDLSGGMFSSKMYMEDQMGSSFQSKESFVKPTIYRNQFCKFEYPNNQI